MVGVASHSGTPIVVVVASDHSPYQNAALLSPANVNASNLFDVPNQQLQQEQFNSVVSSSAVNRPMKLLTDLPRGDGGDSGGGGIGSSSFTSTFSDVVTNWSGVINNSSNNGSYESLDNSSSISVFSLSSYISSSPYSSSTSANPLTNGK